MKYGHDTPLNVLSWLIFLLAFVSNAVNANVRVPNNPQTTAECENFDEQMKEVARQKWARWQQLYDESRAVDRQGIQACSGGRDYSRCKAPYDARVHQLSEAMKPISADHREFENNRHNLYMQCRATAKANEQRAAQEKHAEEEKRRAAEQQRRHQEQAAREAEARQRQAQAESERQQRESEHRQRQVQAEADRQRQAQIRQQQDQQNQQYQQQVAVQQRVLVQQQQIMQQQAALNTQAQMQAQVQAQARQQVALSSIGTLASVAAPKPTTSFADQAIDLVTPKGPAQVLAKAVETKKFADAVLEKTTEPSKLPSVVVDKKAEETFDKYGLNYPNMTKETLIEKTLPTYANTDQLRRDSLDRVLNPQRDSNKAIDYAVDQAKEMNSVVQKTRFGTEGKAIAQIGNDAIAGTGSVANRTLGEFERAMAKADQALPGPTSSSAATGGSSWVTRPMPAAPMPLVNSTLGVVPASTTMATTVSTSNLEALEGASVNATVAANQHTSTTGTTDLFALLGGSDSPRSSCSALGIAEQSTCLVRQCAMAKFANHVDCKDLKK